MDKVAIIILSLSLSVPVMHDPINAALTHYFTVEGALPLACLLAWLTSEFLVALDMR